MMKEREEVKLEIEVLEERIAPTSTGQQGYEGQPGNQGNGLLGYGVGRVAISRVEVVRGRGAELLVVVGDLEG